MTSEILIYMSLVDLFLNQDKDECYKKLLFLYDPGPLKLHKAMKKGAYQHLGGTPKWWL